MAAMRSTVRYLPHLYFGSHTAIGNQRINVLGAVGMGLDLDCEDAWVCAVIIGSPPFFYTCVLEEPQVMKFRCFIRISYG